MAPTANVHKAVREWCSTQDRHAHKIRGKKKKLTIFIAKPNWKENLPMERKEKDFLFNAFVSNVLYTRWSARFASWHRLSFIRILLLEVGFVLQISWSRLLCSWQTEPEMDWLTSKTQLRGDTVTVIPVVYKLVTQWS